MTVDAQKVCYNIYSGFGKIEAGYNHHRREKEEHPNYN
jgi:hypothetical protein